MTQVHTHSCLCFFFLANNELSPSCLPFSSISGSNSGLSENWNVPESCMRSDGSCRYLKSVLVFGIFSVFLRLFGIRYRYFKIPRSSSSSSKQLAMAPLNRAQQRLTNSTVHYNVVTSLSVHDSFGTKG